MSSINRSPAFIRKRKFLLMLPALVLPFVIILFYLIGGGRKPSSSTGEKQTGLNLQLPDAHFLKKKEPDKLALYEASNKDSDKLKLALRNDPYRADSAGSGRPYPENGATIKNIFEKTAKYLPGEDLAVGNPSLDDRETAKKEKELMEKLNKLKDQLNKPTHVSPEPMAKDAPQAETSSTVKTANRLRIVNDDNEPDPEMIQLNKMLDKLMAIQHPQSVAGTLSGSAGEQKSLTYAVSLNQDSEEPGSFGRPESYDTMESRQENRFYGLADDLQTEQEPDNAIKAVIPEDQTLVSGSTIKLRLLNDIRINGHFIPKGQFIYGTCSMNNERLKIRFGSIHCANSILPVALDAYDLDGLAGIFIPGSINRDAVKQSGDQAINSLGLTGIDPSIGAQAASAGIQTAKTLLSHSVKLVKVRIKAGYQVLLKDDRK